MVVSDESSAGDPNRYAEVDDVLNRLYGLGTSEQIATGTPADDDLVFIGDTSRTAGTRIRAIELSDLTGRLDVADIGSGSATDGQVPTADGSGGIAWEDQEGGGGGSNRFDLYDDVTDYIGNGNLNLDDRMVVADISETGEPQNYVEVDDVLEGLHDKITGLDVDAAPANNDRFAVSDVSRAAGFRVRGLRWDDLVGYLPVADMDSESATDGQVATADGSGGIAWEDQAGGGGTFDLHDDVPNSILAGDVAEDDRLMASNEDVADDPNRYITVGTLIDSLHDTGSAKSFTGTPQNNDLVFIGDVSRDDGNRIRGSTWSNFESDLRVGMMSSGGAATDGQVATADGSGGIDWEDSTGDFNLHDDVTTNIGNNLNLSDRMVISDESIVGDPNRYAEVRTILNELYYLANGRLLTDALADDDVIAIGDTSQLASTDKLQGMQFDEFLENLTVADMDSEAATDGQVATADGSGGIAWEDAGAGGAQGVTAADVSVDTTNFSQNLTSADATVQDALETIDGFSQYQGAWQQASWPAGVIVTRSGIAYISLVNSNTQMPTPASTQWSGLPEGFTYRGEAPVAATNYNYGHFTFDPDTDNVYVFTSTVSASVARADIPTHANFIPLVNILTDAESVSPTSHVYGSVSGAQIAAAITAQAGADLTQAQVEDETDTTFGLVSGERLAQAVAVFAPGSGDLEDRTVLVADYAVAQGNNAAPGAVILTNPIVTGQLLTFHLDTVTTTNTDAYFVMVSDDLLALPAQTATPVAADTEDAYTAGGPHIGNAWPNSLAGNSYVWFVDDENIWISNSRGPAFALTITATPMGGVSTTAGQASGGVSVVENQVITSIVPDDRITPG